MVHFTTVVEGVVEGVVVVGDKDGAIVGRRTPGDKRSSSAWLSTSRRPIFIERILERRCSNGMTSVFIWIPS